MKKEKKTEIIGKYQKHGTDTGSADVQIAVLTEKINHLVGHLKVNKKDNHSRRGLLVMVGKRKRLMNYLFRTDEKKFKGLVSSLGLRTTN